MKVATKAMGGVNKSVEGKEHDEWDSGKSRVDDQHVAGGEKKYKNEKSRCR